MWMVRAGKKGIYAPEFISKNCVAIGYGLSAEAASYSYDEILKYMMLQEGEGRKDRAVQFASTVFRFFNDIGLSDDVVTYDPSTRNYHIGTILSGPQYKPDEIGDLKYTRQVSWKSVRTRDDLSLKTRYALGPTTAVFKIADQAAKELSGSKPEISITEEDIQIPEAMDLADDATQRAREAIKDKIIELSWDEAQELVAGLLRAMGYRARVSPAGPDKGRDIIASPDGLGFERPRIVVEVKHKKRVIGAPDIRSFVGGCHADDRGLYVSTGGFSKEAEYEAVRAQIPLTLMDIESLVDSICEHYEKMEIETRAILPLRKVYWPVSK